MKYNTSRYSSIILITRICRPGNRQKRNTILIDVITRYTYYHQTWRFTSSNISYAPSGVNRRSYFPVVVWRSKESVNVTWPQPQRSTALSRLVLPTTRMRRAMLVFRRRSVWTCRRGMDYIDNPLSGEQFDSSGRACIRWVTSALEAKSSRHKTNRKLGTMLYQVYVYEENQPHIPPVIRKARQP